MSRTTATVLMVLVHVVFFFSFVLGMRPFDMGDRTMVETILTLPVAGNNQPKEPRISPQPLIAAPPRIHCRRRS